MKTLIVLSGGGPTGIDIHAGMLKAVHETGLVPDFWVGNSAGSPVAAKCATNGFDADELIKFTKTLNNDLLDYRNMWILREAWLDSIMSNQKIFNALKAALPAEFPANLNIWATKLPDLNKVNVCDPSISPDLPTSILASMAIHGVWPVVTLKDGDYTDGGFRWNTPYDREVYPEYDNIWILIAIGAPNKYVKGQTGLLTLAKQDIAWLVENSTLNVVEKYINDPRVKIIWPLLDTPGLKFDHSLIDKAYVEAKKQIYNIFSFKTNSYSNHKIDIIQKFRELRKV